MISSPLLIWPGEYKKVDTNGDGIPDTFVIIGETKQSPAPIPKIKKPDGKSLVSYFRLRVELSITSGAARLTLKEAENILTARLMEARGDPARKGATAHRMWVMQQEGTKELGGSAGITVDYAVSPEALDGPLRFILEKSTPNQTVIRISNVTDDKVELIEEKQYQGAGTLEFSASLKSLKNKQPLHSEIKKAASEEMVRAFYYPWYDSLRNWKSPTLQDRPATPYVSHDPAAIERHIEEARSAGIDGFLSSWWGPGSYTDENLKILLDVAKEKRFSVGINFETLGKKDAEGNDSPLDGREIYNWLRYLISTYRAHPAMMKVNGKPLIVLWASNAVPIETWESVLDRLRKKGLDATFLGHFSGDDPSIAELDIFDGLHTYNILSVISDNKSIPELARTYATTGRAVLYYQLLMDSPTPKIWAATVQPGYDDHLIPGRKSPILDREEGRLYRSSFEASIASDPDWIFICSWNEWWEHTYIEPSEKYGRKNLEITREYSDKWKRGNGLD